MRGSVGMMCGEDGWARGDELIYSWRINGCRLSGDVDETEVFLGV